MKLKIVLSMIVGLLAINAFAAGVVTQKVTAVADQLPITGDQFQKQINTAVYQISTFDIPNIVAALNGGATTNAALVASIMSGTTTAFNVNVAHITNAVTTGAFTFPTTTNGLTTGQIWANSGVLTLKP